MAAGYLVLSDGRKIEARDGLTMGRAVQCDLVLEDTKASRRHARLSVEGSVVEIEDLDSSNGTTLNGKPVKQRVLRPDDEIMIGTTRLRFVVESAAGTAAAPLELGLELGLGIDDPYQPGGGLEGDPLAQQPAPEPKPAVPPPPARDVEVIEFVDEVVEVRRAPERPAPATSSRMASTKADLRETAGPRQHGVLRFAPKSKDKGLLGDDLRQMSSLQRGALILACIAAAVGLGYGVMMLVAGV